MSSSYSSKDDDDDENGFARAPTDATRLDDVTSTLSLVDVNR
jgi:hypothetical protein